MSHTGPMYIAICSLKHESSTAFTHGRNFDHVLELEKFVFIAKNGDQLKHIVLAFVDGGPNENRRFPKVLSVAIEHLSTNLSVYCDYKCNWNVCRMSNGSIEQGTDWGCSQS